jgi:hypothetical protein
MMPLFVETLLLMILAYLVGLGVARLIWGREKKESFL